jgi:hypothetical protein
MAATVEKSSAIFSGFSFNYYFSPKFQSSLPQVDSSIAFESKEDRSANLMWTALNVPGIFKISHLKILKFSIHDRKLQHVATTSQSQLISWQNEFHRQREYSCHSYTCCPKA